MKKYTQINSEERAVIAHLWRNNKSINHIAKQLKRSWNTVEYEIMNNGHKDKFGINIYYAEKAQKVHNKRRKDSRFKQRKIENNFELEKIIRLKIVDKQYSPEVIAGELALYNSKTLVSHVTIYKYIYDSNDKELTSNLRRQGKKYIYSNGSKNVSVTAPKLNISERPKVIGEKTRLGDFEGDTVILQGTERLYTLVDRKSKYLFVEYMINGKAETVYEKTLKIFNENKYVFTSITYDNGVEFSYHDLISIEIHAPIYFANPYHSWERGINENTNGLLRQYFPKGATYVNISNDDVQRVADLLNHRPRKTLNFLSPYQVFVLKLDPKKDGLKLRKRTHRFGL